MYVSLVEVLPLGIVSVAERVQPLAVDLLDRDLVVLVVEPAAHLLGARLRGPDRVGPCLIARLWECVEILLLACC